MKKRLTCLEVKKYKRKDGTDGYKYIFVDDQDVPYVAYGDTDGLVEDVTNGEGYEPARAREYECNRDVFNGTMTVRVVLPPINL